VDLVFDTSTAPPSADEPRLAGARVVRVDPDLMRPGPRLSVVMGQFARAIDEASAPAPER
jgi:hypothetical protein